MATGLLTNLALGGVGLATAGGLIGGGYFMLKSNPRPMTYFLATVKKKTLLDANSDADIWNANWKLYLSDNAPKEKSVPKESEALSPAPAIVEEKDAWEIPEFKDQIKKRADAPQSFKNKCGEKSKFEVNGIWDAEFQKVEKYCTKPTEEAD